MARTFMAVYSNPASPEQEDEYNTWYDDVHMTEIQQLPGVVAATRYRLADIASAASSEHRYLAVYEMEGSSEEAFAGFGANAAGLTQSSAIDMAGARILFWEPITGSAG
jgi:hypothetical protein